MPLIPKETPMNAKKHQGIPRIAKEQQGMSWNAKEHQGVPRNAKKDQRIPKSINERNSKECYRFLKRLQ